MGNATPATSWRPPADAELTWFKAGGQLPRWPKPLEFSLPIQAFSFGISRALESIYLPLYEVRTRLIDGELYLASVPSALAELDLDAQFGRMRDSGLRFTRGVRASWERAIRREVETYNDRLAAFAPEEASDREVAADLMPLRRARANQWFAATRAVFAPTVMLEHGIGETPVAEAQEVSREALEAIRGRGARLLDEGIKRVGRRLAHAGRIEASDDIRWLDLSEVRDALDRGDDYRPVVTQRKAEEAKGPRIPGPELVGPPLPPDSPRMYLVREILSLIA